MHTEKPKSLQKTGNPQYYFFLYAEIQKGILYIKKNMTNKNTKQMLQFIGRQIICCWDRNLQ